MRMWRFCHPWKFNKTLYDFLRVVEELVLTASMQVLIAQLMEIVNVSGLSSSVMLPFRLAILTVGKCLYLGIDYCRQDVGTTSNCLSDTELTAVC
ncbi:hypothetical protein KY284_004276 [Solanum tuberosum]|nr:hypothetical protein KY284_004276 [Solanum tuberosum]